VTKRLVIAILVTALSAAAAASAAPAAVTFGPHTAVTVTPARGTPTTTFTVGFKTPVATGSSQGSRIWEVASVASRGRTSASCTSGMAVPLRPTVAHHHISVALPASAKPWCTGTYAGTITLNRTIRCDPGPPSRRAACPELVFAPELIGRFQFTVAVAAS
jgi:hypothetical protein